MRKEFFVGVDSDGTVFNSMNVKHYKAFIPAFISVWNLSEYESLISDIESEINLFSLTRGINRFPGLLILLNRLKEQGIAIEDTTLFEKYINSTKVYSNKTLDDYLLKHNDSLLSKVCKWSHLADELFSAAMQEEKPFLGVNECFSSICNKVDIFSISSASKESLYRDWSKGGLTEYIKELLAQENGSKYDQIESQKQYYKKENMIVLGDSLSDLDAATKAGVWFFPIIPNHEIESWKEFSLVAFKKLINYSFNEEYQDELINKFRKALLRGKTND